MMIRIKAACFALTALLTAGIVSSAEPERKSPSPEVPAEKFYKNIQVLKGVPSTELIPTMNFMADSLGVKCSYCHVTTETGRWPLELDDKPAKRRAREMIQMMREIDSANFKSHLKVTCATCHRGSTTPATMPLLASETGPTPAPTAADAAATQPSANAVLGKYVAAIGGAEAMARIGSRLTRGTFTAGDGQGHPIEIKQTASGKYRSSVTVKDGSFTIVFDGKTGASISPNRQSPMQPDEMERIRSRARLFPLANLTERFPTLTVEGKEKLSGRDAWVVAASSADGKRESFWFDAENGLLVRRLERQTTALGDIPEQTEYLDYRDVGGVKVPFTIRHTAPDRGDTITAAQIEQNVEFPDSDFTAPAPVKPK